MRFAARLAVFIFLFLSIGTFLFASPTFAQTTTQQAISQDTNADVPQNLHTLSQSVTLEVISSFICLLDGTDPTNPQQPCLGFDPNTHKIGYVKSSGLIGTMTGLTMALYTPPVRVGEYVSYVSNNFGLVKKSYAAAPCTGGVGFCGISPLIGIWSTFRNIIYLFFVVIFILVGFGIMLRMKIDPRTVMSIENQIPKLIIGLLLVTFSFAIAGLLIDGMWIGSFVAVNVLTSADTTPNKISPQTVNNNFFQNPFGFSNNVLPGGDLGVAAGAAGGTKDIIQSLFTPNNSKQLGLFPPSPSKNDNCNPQMGAGDWILLFGFTPIELGIKGIQGANCITSTIANLSLGDILAGSIGWLLSYVIGAIAILVILIAIIIAMFRLWFTLLLSYVFILLDVLLGPFMIAFGLLPGSKIGFGSWVRDMLANLIAFPTVIAMFLLGRLLMNSFTSPGNCGNLFVPPVIGNPVGTSGCNNDLGFLIGLGVILMTPQVVAMMKSLFKAPENKFGALIGQTLSSAGGVITGATKETVGGIIHTKFGPLGTKGESGLLVALRRWAR